MTEQSAHFLTFDRADRTARSSAHGLSWLAAALKLADDLPALPLDDD
jgi:hypothetical protein